MVRSQGSSYTVHANVQVVPVPQVPPGVHISAEPESFLVRPGHTQYIETVFTIVNNTNHRIMCEYIVVKSVGSLHKILDKVTIPYGAVLNAMETQQMAPIRLKLKAKNPGIGYNITCALKWENV